MVESKDVGDEMNRRLIRWCKGYTAPPTKITIFLTYNCNLKCRFCKLSVDTPKNDKVTRQEWLNTVEEGVEMGIKEWEFSGTGEPLLKANLFVELLKKIKSKEKNECILITNGVLIDEEIAKDMVKNRLDRIYFSLDGSDALTHDDLRGVEGTYFKVIESIKLINEYKNKFNSDKPNLGITAVLNNMNYRHTRINRASKHA